MGGKKTKRRGRSLNDRFKGQKRTLPVVPGEHFGRIDELASDAMATGKYGCDQGCSFCCYQPVVVAPQEVASLFQAAIERGPDFVEGLTKKAVTLRDQFLRMTDKERFEVDEPCPILVDGRCSLYDARPFACRGLLVSTETMKSCETGETEVSLDGQTSFIAGQLSSDLCREMQAPPLDLTIALAAILERRNRISTTTVAELFGGDKAMAPMFRMKLRGLPHGVR